MHECTDRFAPAKTSQARETKPEPGLFAMRFMLERNSRAQFCKCFFASEQKRHAMTTSEQKAELLKELSIFSKDETMKQKALKALRRITGSRRSRVR